MPETRVPLVVMLRIRPGYVCSARYIFPLESQADPIGSVNAPRLSANVLNVPVELREPPEVILNTFMTPVPASPT